MEVVSEQLILLQLIPKKNLSKRHILSKHPRDLAQPGVVWQELPRHHRTLLNLSTDDKHTLLCSSSESARLAPLVGAGQTPDLVEARLFDQVEQTAAGV